MSDRDSGSSSSPTDEEDERNEVGRKPPSFSSFSSTIRAVIRIKHKYQAMKKKRQEMALSSSADRSGSLHGAPERASPKIFTFDGLPPSPATVASSLKKKKKKKKRVLFPTGGGRRAPPKPERSRATYFLYLLFAIVFIQVFNAIENLDDHVIRYDLDGLEKTLRREVFGQQGATEALLSHLRDYLSTYVHNKPLVLSLHGPSGVGKSHLGRLLAGHFRSVVGDALVLQYYVLHHCPLEADASLCARDLSARVTATVERAEEEEKIPLFIFDEAEHMHREILDALRRLVLAERSNEHLNAIYLFLSNLGHAHITKHALRNSSGVSSFARELTPVLRATLEKLHPFWSEVDILPMTLLEKSHVVDCFLDEVAREGFYPDRANIERLAGEIEYYPAVGGREFAVTGCKQVVAKVNLL